MLPVATLTSVTASGDVITAPGDPKYLATALPIACMGDIVAGAACSGAITTTTSKVIALGRPIATLTSAVAGLNPVSGIPVATALAVTVSINQIR